MEKSFRFLQVVTWKGIILLVDQNQKICIDRIVIVEGKYDKIKLDSILDAIILQTDGFRIFKNKEQRELIRRMAKEKGVLVITDSDTAGFKIRNHIQSIAKDGDVQHLYIPQILGKEQRKRKASKEGTLGVEGLDAQLLRELLHKQGITCEETPIEHPITKTDFYQDGLIGQSGSRERRQKLLQRLELPEYMSTNALLSVVNILMTREDYELFLQTLS